MKKEINPIYTQWSRNVVDKYKFFSEEEIKLDLKKNSLPFSICFLNVIGDFNIATGIRNANAFGARDIFYIGNKKFDRRATVGVLNYTDINHLSSLEELKFLKERFIFVASELTKTSTNLVNFDWPKNKEVLIIFGEEGSGLSEEVLNLCDFVVEIPQTGSVPSLNVGTASGIIMYDYVRKMTPGA